TLMYQSSRAAEHSSDEHAQIVKALAAKDEALAVRLMEEHLHHVEANLDFDPAPATHAIDAIASAFS
ncbi:MAG: FCD domain-containing protein, partial [Rhodoferax sp.]